MGLFDNIRKKAQEKAVNEIKKRIPDRAVNILGTLINQPVENQTPTVKNNSVIPNWEISISFRKSSSDNFDTAIFLAKKSNKYLETKSEGKTIYQAFYNESNYSEFEILFKLIKDWKSTFILLNGDLIDKKTMSKLNRCLGDKTRFKDDKFCFGASEFTSNPFGCHRLMITPSQTPWWQFGSYNRKGEWIIDKERLRNQITNKSNFYNMCPYFDLSKALYILDKLPNKLTKQKDSKVFNFHKDGIYPETFNYYKIDKFYLR